jgi:putative Ig domain-containing protein
MPQARIAGVLLSIGLVTIALPTIANTIQVSGTPPVGAVGERYYWLPVTSGGNKATMQFAYVNPPAWSGEYRSSGAIIGTPTQPGTYSNIVIEAWDGVNFGVSPPLTVTIAGRGSSPTSQSRLAISGTPETTVEEGKYYSFRPTVVAPSGILSYAIQNKPSWAQFSASTGTLAGTPTSAGETSDIIITVSDGAEHASLSPFSISVDSPAPSEAGAVNLSWSVPTSNTDGTSLTNLAGYVVRYGTSRSAMKSQISVKSTKVEISNLAVGTWYFEVASINSANIQSQFSPFLSAQVQ